MKIQLYVLMMTLCLLTSCNTQGKYNADKQLGEKEQHQIMLSVIRYMGHLPKKGTHENKFERQFDEYYSKLALDYTVEAYHKGSDFEYFMASRIAPSLKVKKVAIGVKMIRNSNGEIEFYEEVFRTWKFEEDEMLEKGMMLFDLMVKGEDLSPYYPQNSGKEEYIEFPDQKVSYDIEQRRWVSSAEAIQ
ncbi:hypothetical protein ACFOUP_13790 [Belliella kenyensis]|uniref:DUF4136 domain-containing protein n=1 Tax=Belliella kenyensis TaxID=1472724 RepID=A0ABV8ER09_9BACT|nr:hypothetical protein [Belliella kenyensis]MCH7401514.1 hypothetical protein [Belliella kenyensis]MDN3603205.1 hypothetical protein [Belliella kenyensis]